MAQSTARRTVNPPTFQKQIRDLAKSMSHDELASILGIKRSLLRNWIYKDAAPGPFAQRSLAKQTLTLWKKNYDHQ
jgi:DNA-binding transcriptional regulator YiaG